MSIQVYNPFGGYNVIVSRYSVTVLSLVLAVPVIPLRNALRHWITGGHIDTFLHQPIRQDKIEKKLRSPIQIRPPPL